MPVEKLTEETFYLIDDRRIRMMKPSAHLINTSNTSPTTFVQHGYAGVM